ncbi:hypothetical protein RclHR1_00230019 [Rhizophagus clarus]|uniref:Saposin B-type domain-containing protein n=1 Tax=Rhizophagus clarus TaxID=94130 RepID=A0A2Z6RB16_9GLOM|nr:hypothetical protein RclHR1_00230019 [Rhizophagus clarus]GES72924.1 hypothetical protein GLOIN_2v1727228 [Rhizophagus clarus]
MKSFSYLVFLNVLILFAYAQDQPIPATSCEQRFALQGTTCTPCQQALFKHNFIDTSAAIAKQPPSDKCMVTSIFSYHLLEEISTTPGTSAADVTKVKNALDKTCADTANNACSESDAKSAYTEVDKACDAELNQYLSGKDTTDLVGTRAVATITLYYLAIPLRDILCSKVGNEYCFVKFFEQANKTQTTTPNANPFGPNSLQCDDCSKQAYNSIKSFQSSHPLDTPNLQKIMANTTTKEIQAFEQKCPNLAKSDAQRLTNQFYNYLGIILTCLVGFLFM